MRKSLITVIFLFACCVSIVAQPASPLYDFRTWSSATVANLQAVALANDDAAITADTPWSTSEKAADVSTNDGHGFFNHAALNDAALAANGTPIAETSGLSVTASSHGLGVMNDLYSTSMGNYNGGSYLWLTGNATSIVVSGVACGAVMTIGIESHNVSDARGVTVSYKNASGEWVSLGSYTTKEYADQQIQIPEVDGKTATDVKLQATKGMHLYYIDVAMSGMKVLTESFKLKTGDERTLADGTDYVNVSGAAISFATSDASVATVTSAGVIAAVGVGTANITLTQGASGVYTSSSKTITVQVMDTNVNPTFTTNLNATYDVLQGRTARLKVAMVDGDTYQWYTCTDIDGNTGKTPIEGATSDYYYIPDDWSNGTYYVYCLATNSVNGNYTMSQVATVTVAAKAHTYDFTSWSMNTVGNLMAGVYGKDGELNPGSGWSDFEASGKTSYEPASGWPSKENCFWQVAHEEGTLHANGDAIEELSGLSFHNTNDRGLAIALDYLTANSSAANFGPYHSNSYLWLGGKGIGSKFEYFTIPNVKVGSVIRMGVESHKIDSNRGVRVMNKTTNETLTDPDGNAVAYPKTFEEQAWLVTGTGQAEGDVTDITVTNNDGTHIYYIDVEMQGFKLLSNTQLMAVGEEYTLTEHTDYVSYSSAAVKVISSSNPEVATVDEDGKIKAVGVGTATISVKQEASDPYSESIVTYTLNVRKLYTVTYAKGSDAAVKGNTLPAVRYEENRQIQLAAPNQLLYKAGYTQTGWSDGTRTYELGADYTVVADVVFTPVFTANTADKTLANLNTPRTVTWQFGRANGAPVVDWKETTVAQPNYLVEQCIVNGETQDIALKINTSATGAKFSNASRVDRADAQVNAHTTFTLPASNGMQITLRNVYETMPEANVTAVGLDATAMTWNASAKTLTYTYNGNAAEITIDAANVGYLDGISVKYFCPSDLTVIEGHETVTLKEGERHTLGKDVAYTTASTGALTFASDNSNVATVNASGEIIAVGAGSATITVSQAATDEHVAGSVTYNVNVSAATEAVVITTDLPATGSARQKAANDFSIAAENASYYQWYTCEGADKTGATAIAGATNPEISFHPASQGVTYLYCVAGNSIGEVSSTVCKLTVSRKLQWNFSQTAEQVAALQASVSDGKGYWTTASNGRFVTSHAYTDEEVKIDENTALPIMEGLLVTGASSNQLLVGSPTNTKYNRLQLNAEHTLTIPGCKAGDEINIVCEQASNSGTRTLQVADSFCDLGLGDDRDYIQNTESKSTFKFTMLHDGDCKITATNYAIYGINIFDETYQKKSYVYSVVAVDSLTNETLSYVLPVTTAWEGDVISEIPYSYWMRTTDNRLVRRESRNKNFHMNYEVNRDTTFVILYKDTDIDKVVYLSEAENIPGLKACGGSTVEVRASYGGAAYCDVVKGVKITTLPAGRYAVRVGILDAKSGGKQTMALLAGKDSIRFVTPATSNTNQFCELVDTISIDEATDIIMPKGGDDNLGFDIIAIYDVSLPKADTPAINVDNASATFTITAGDDEDDIYYTTDSSVPTTTHGIYYDGNPVHLPTNCVIKAVAFHSQKTRSDVAETETEFTTYRVNVSPLPSTYGLVQITPLSKNGSYTVGTEITLRAVSKSGYGFEGWSTTSDGDIKDGMTEPVHTFTMPEENVRLYAIFAQGIEGTVRYDLAATKWYEAEDVEGTPQTINGAATFPTEIKSSSVIVPSNYSLYVENYTLLYWEDSEGNKYECGVNKLFTEDFNDVTLHPVYMQNKEADILNIRTVPVTVTWDFRTGYGAQPMTMESGVAENRNYVTHATVSGQTTTDQTIDVAAVITTTEQAGHFTNEDIDTWSYMSTGTKITMPSGSGAKFTLATYAPISDDMGGTRVNGQLPDNIYDEELVKNSEGHYLYTWTVDREDLTAELIIGNDYAYYAYVTAELRAAGVKTLSVSSDNTAKGTVKIATEGGTKVSGGYAFINGSYIKVDANRSRFYELDYWLDGDGNKIYPDSHWVDASGESRNNEKNPVFSIGNITYSYVGQDSIKFQLGQNLTLQAVFKDKKSFYIDFSSGGQAEGLPPLQQHVEEGEKFTMPLNNNRLYLEGYTLVDYTDADGNHYKFGSSYMPTSDLLLMPNFKRNGLSLGDIAAATTATWQLTTAENAPDLYYNKSQGLTVTQLKFANDSIDVPLYIDGNAGALSNLDNSSYCVVSAGCVLTMPTSKNCTISLKSINGAFQNTVIAGATALRSSANSSAYGLTDKPMVTYTGNDAMQDILMKESRRCTYVSVTYMPIEKPELTKVKYGDSELTSAQLEVLKTAGKLEGIECAASYEDEILTAVTAAVNDGIAEVVQPTDANPVAQITVKTVGGVVVDVYTISFNVTSKVAPAIVSATVSGKEASYNGSSTVSGVGESGVIALTFDHYMQDAELSSNTGLGQTVNAKADGKTLKLTYWNLAAGNTYTLTIPSGTLKDAYGTAFGSAVVVKFTPVKRTTQQSRLFNFVVTHKQDWNCETQTPGERIQVVSDEVIANLEALKIHYGTIDEATEEINATGGSERYYVFVPDGEYCMKGNTKGILNGVFNDTKLGSNQGLNVENYYNGRTYINRDNVSIVGQSQEGTVLYNDPYIYGISNTSTIEVRSKKQDCYFQDFTVDNRFSKYQVDRGDANPSGQAVAVYDRGIHSIWKNVTMKGYQDTYASASNSSGFSVEKGQLTPGCFHTYRYYEDCQVWGTVDFLCGGGDDWWERPTFVLRKRATANNIVAPRHWHPSVTKYCTGADSLFTEKWGFVFNNAKVKAESDAAYSVQNGKFTLGRPWAYSPTCTYLNTDFAIKPADGGWSNMSGTLVLRMHEYGSTLNGAKMDLTQRSLRASTPAAGSDDCILTSGQAAQYTLHNVLGGDDAYDPTIYTRQISMANSNLNNSTGDDGSSVLVWDPSEDALCYFIFRIDEQTGDTLFHTIAANTLYNPGENQAGRRFLVRAANERGGLGAPSDIVTFKPLDSYVVSVKEVGLVPGMGWSTICLPQNTTFRSTDSITVYAAVKVEKTTMTLMKVTNQGLKAGRGYIIYAKAPATYTFMGTHKPVNTIYGDVYSVLDGNPEDHAVSVGTLNIYTLAFKADINNQVGFYKFVGSQIPARKAYLSTDYLYSQGIRLENLAKGMSMQFVDDEDFEEDATDVKGVTEDTGDSDSVYDLSGKRIPRSKMRRGEIYVIEGEKKLWDGE